MEPAWPEKIVGGLFVLVMFFALMLGVVSGGAAHDPGSLGVGMVQFAIQFGLFVALPLWGLLRLFDWIGGGPARRRPPLIIYPNP